MMTQIRTVTALASTFKNVLAGRLLQSGGLARLRRWLALLWLQIRHWLNLPVVGRRGHRSRPTRRCGT